MLVQDYQLSLVPGQLRAQRPDLRVLHFAHTPFCEPDGMRVLPTDIAEALCGSLASAPAGFHTRRWADAYEASARVVGLDFAHTKDPSDAPGRYYTTRYFCENGVTTMGYVSNLGAITNPRVVLIALPLSIKGAEASPVRAVVLDGAR